MSGGQIQCQLVGEVFGALEHIFTNACVVRHIKKAAITSVGSMVCFSV